MEKLDFTIAMKQLYLYRLFWIKIYKETMMMQEIKWPKCGGVFVMDESGYAQIVQQVRDKEFDKELRHREEDVAEKKE